MNHRSYTHNLSSWEFKAEKKKKSGLNGIQTIDLCDTGTVVPVHSNGKTMIFKLNWKLKQEYLQLEYGTL